MASSNEAERAKEIAWLKQALKSAPPDSPLAAQMRQRLAELTGEAEPEKESAPREEAHTAGGDFVGRDKTVRAGENGIAIGGNVNNSTLKVTQYIAYGAYNGPLPKTPAESERIYREVLTSLSSQVPLRGMGAPEAESPTSTQGALDLAGVYIQLDTQETVAQERLQQALQTLPADPWHILRPKHNEEESQRQPSEAVPLSALDAVILFRKMVLLGDPGSGKTTFVNHLTHALARRDWDALPHWPEAERNALPLLVVLRDFAHWLNAPENQKYRHAKRLWAFIANDLDNRGLEFAAPLLREALEAGRAVVLLDGLDEVPPGQRETVLRAVQDFVTRYPDNRFVVTCRVLSYQEPAWRLPPQDFPAFTLKPFSEEQIRAFIQAWHNEVAACWNKPRQTVTYLEKKLLTEVFRRPDLRRLAPNPLLLTVIALVHTIDGELPQTRVILYSRAVNILLWQWEQEKRKAYGEQASLLQLLQQANRNQRDLLVVLAKLAYRAHEQIGQQQEEDGDEVPGIPEMDLLRGLRKLHPEESLDWAEQVVKTLRLRTGLLVERAPGVFAFPHRTFQEYLAGMHLALQSDFVKKALARAREGDFWRIVILLGTGYQVYERLELEKPRLLIEELCPPETEDTPEAWRLAWLAGEVILEMGANRLIQDSAYGKRLLRRVRERLAVLLETGALTPAERLEAGDTLGKLGDPRFDLHRLHLPVLLRGQPEPAPLGFVHIPAGAYWLGSPDDDKMADERPLHQVHLPEFWIARYPVINAQFSHFVETGGYDTERYWTPEGWEWRNGKEPSPKQLRFYTEEWQKKMVERARSKPSEPYWWGDPKWGAATRPVVGVTWYEALAYCAWLGEQVSAFSRQASAQSEEEERFWAAVASGRYRFTLPSEAEWEAAARGWLPSPSGRGAGGEGVRRYPWGEEITPAHANYDETGLGQTSPVGMFPQGATPETDLLDLSGNVWEWTRSKWGMDLMTPDYGYPYQPEDGREILRGPELRVVRGGSWDLSRWAVRAAFRNRSIPDLFGNILGIRVVLSLAGKQVSDVRGQASA